MYENEENRLFGPMITAPHICLLLLLIYVGGLTADIENQVIVVKPFLTESSGPHESLESLSNTKTWFEYCRWLEIPNLVLN